MDINPSKEVRITFTLLDGAKYEGNIRNYSEDTEVLTINNIIQFPENLPVGETMAVQLDDVIDMKVIEENKQGRAPRGENSRTENLKPLTKITKGEYFRLLNSQRGYRFINKVCSNFHSAMVDLRNSKIVGLCGRELIPGRHKKLCVIALATETGVYVFDLKKLKSKPFDKGLKYVLESESIVKVVYDCRFLSDCLYHKHSITLTNVRDVEAEDVVITYNQSGSIRRITRQFSSLIHLYLGISGDSVKEENLNAPWKKISRNTKLQSFLANYVSYLIPVHRSIESFHLRKLEDASKLYSEVIRNSRDISYIFKDNTFVMVKEMRNIVMPPLTLSDKLSEIEL